MTEPKTRLFPADGDLAIDPSVVRDSAGGFLEFMFGSGPEQTYQNVNGVGLITIDGPIDQRAGMFEGYDGIRARFEAALADTNVQSVVMRIDSPGGAVAGMFEARGAMLAAKKKSGKPVYASADEQATSAAYALATVADEVYAPATGALGSIGVITMLVDQTGMLEQAGIKVAVVTSGAQKADGSPLVPMSEDVVARTQARIDMLAAMFAQAVADSRGTSVEKVMGLDAAVLMGAEAKGAKLSDGVLGFDGVMAKATKAAKTASKSGPKMVMPVAAVAGMADAPLVTVSGAPSEEIGRAIAEALRKDLAAIAAPIVPLAKAVPYSPHKPVDSGSWDGAAAEQRMRKWASSDGSGNPDKMDWAKYRSGFAWYDEKNAEAFGSYKLPHHDIQNGEMVTSRAGVIAAGNVVSGSRGGAKIDDEEAVRAHLAKHYAQFKMTPPWEAKAPAASPQGIRGKKMDGHVYVKLGLAADASEADAVMAIDELQCAVTAAKAELERFVALSGKATAPEARGVFAAAMSAVAELSSARADVARLTQNAQNAEAKALIDSAQQAHKVMPATRAKVEKLYIEHGIEALRAHIDALVPVAPSAEHKTPEHKDSSVGETLHDGRRYEQMVPGERAQLRSSGALGERLYQELRTDWISRGKPQRSA